MISVVGMGPGNSKLLTFQAYEKIKEASCLIAFGRISKTAEMMEKETIVVKTVDEIMKVLEKNEDVTILASGDPCFYGVLEYLKNKNVAVDEVIPGISSFQYMMSLLKKSWDRANLLSLHGREDSLKETLNKKLSVILTDSSHNPDYISKRLKEIGFTGKIYCGFDLSYPEERIIVKNAGEEIGHVSSLSLVVVENEAYQG
ncbi:putative cobalt-precorrin-6Y C(5)-methyltransferase [Oxobacter pfennigii]|uniref:Putative cobalt-precorrin-6Y C(5)-methyltransferase n=1 Tax=Oxobacter pfennigii TaxID=36849 RepID=A0A0P8WBW2_9CLOT|nr:precorrin-6y C5,15-methyltransferase (decarboxylating) subunit CbiE [Oxobacter pfennigii]KPU45406.1 putative cobalt-precorrin-6Y C(5)-methyltransferase [Oxobacter pfennigii]